MKWKWRNDRRSERNLCNCVKKPEKIQDFNGVWTRDLAITSAMLYQLSYEVTDVGSRSIVGVKNTFKTVLDIVRVLIRDFLEDGVFFRIV